MKLSVCVVVLCVYQAYYHINQACFYPSNQAGPQEVEQIEQFDDCERVDEQAMSRSEEQLAVIGPTNSCEPMQLADPAIRPVDAVVAEVVTFTEPKEDGQLVSSVFDAPVGSNEWFAKQDQITNEANDQCVQTSSISADVKVGASPSASTAQAQRIDAINAHYDLADKNIELRFRELRAASEAESRELGFALHRTLA
ncbi:hypothetical protein HDU85_007840 [Gaertneriomyces sp. JEL0708]|nr:hypothetical protein HDU85_007840 [Gaertneriomyces sp. JEL0708]